MSPTPSCRRCKQPMRQAGRYADWHCECCDLSARCRHVPVWTRLKRRMSGRRV